LRWPTASNGMITMWLKMGYYPTTALFIMNKLPDNCHSCKGKSPAESILDSGLRRNDVVELSAWSKWKL
jgi:hypothetical protein